MALIGNQKHMYRNKSRSLVTRDRLSPENRKLRDAQSMLNSHLPDDNRDWQTLSKLLLDSAVEAHLTDSDGLGLAINSVFEWSGLEHNASAKLRSNKAMSFLDWQQQLLDEICYLNPERVYMFSKFEVDYFWVVTKSPSTEEILAYSEKYINILDAYPDLVCDFLVYGENEVIEDTLPKDFLLVKRG